MIPALAKLLELSFEAWKLEAKVVVDWNDDGIGLQAGSNNLHITRAPPGMPFRWVVSINGRRRTVASVNGVLRIVRQTLSPGYEPRSMRIAAPNLTNRSAP